MKKVIPDSVKPSRSQPVPNINALSLLPEVLKSGFDSLPAGFELNILLTGILDNGPCLTWILDIRTQQFAYISRNVTELLGYEVQDFLQNGPAFFNQITHPDDLNKSWQLRQQAWALLLTLKPTERQGFKFSNNFRVQTSTGVTIELLEQHSVLQADSSGAITHILGVCTDVTSLKTKTTIGTANSATTKPTISATGKVKKQKPLFSKREIEILKLLAEGRNSKYIAATLFLSFHTVATHRKRIIEKTNTCTTVGAIQFAINQGVIR